jgi:hypothetical protein
MLLQSEYQPDILGKGLVVSYSIDSLASFLQLNVWFQAATIMCGGMYSQALATDSAKYSAIYVPFISKYGIDMSSFAQTSYTEFSTVNDWFVL